MDRNEFMRRAIELAARDLGQAKVGVFGKTCRLDRVLCSGERVEVYRDLIADPKSVKRGKRD